MVIMLGEGGEGGWEDVVERNVMDDAIVNSLH